MHKKGQAAMEFLMTYGWAILAAIIVIAVLAVYFRPSQLSPSSVIVTAPFYGVGTTLSTTQVQVEVRNNGGEQLDLDATTPASLTFNSPSGGACSSVAVIGTDPIPAGGSVVLSFGTCGTTLPSGSTVNADLTVFYTRTGSTLTLQSTGTVSGTI